MPLIDVQFQIRGEGAYLSSRGALLQMKPAFFTSHMTVHRKNHCLCMNFGHLANSVSIVGNSCQPCCKAMYWNPGRMYDTKTGSVYVPVPMFPSYVSRLTCLLLGPSHVRIVAYVMVG